MTFRSLALAIIVAALAGCAGAPRLTEQSIQDAELKFLHGKYVEAARNFTQLAEQARSPRREALLLRAAAALARSGLVPESRKILQSIVTLGFPELELKARLAQSHLALAERQPNQVLDLLITNPAENTESYLIGEHHKLRADANTMLGNKLEIARELVFREAYLTDQSIIKQNQLSIWEALASLTTRALIQLRTNPPPDILSGWMNLVQIAKTYQLDPPKLQTELASWRQSYPKHPILDDMLKALLTRKQEDVKYPNRIALILPLTGKFAKAAEALRDGVLAAYYLHDNHPQQSLRVYDIGDEPKNVASIYQKAVDEGAEFIVGPLDKDALKILADEAPLPVPTLALNYLLEDNNKYGNLYQFGLSPEEEARQVAERTWLDGHVNATALVPSGPWGERVFSTFKQRWEMMGGGIVEQQTYDPTKNDFSAPIRDMLNITDSQHRYRKLAVLLKSELKFNPRRRQDTDFIFLAAYPRQARAIRPQLKFYQATDVPVYATSHVYTGSLNQERDRDMDGLVFGDMPWVLSESTARRSLRTDLERFISEPGNDLQRLYALGIDSYNIIAALNPLRKYPYERYDGETGTLTLDDAQRIRRQLTWVKFRSGQPTLLDQFSQ